ncbi:hypothetical protein CL622_07010 [archaeon]|nr:hypothetical protein [archaeon]
MAVELTIPQRWNDLSHKQFSNIVYQLECYHSVVKDNAEAVKESALLLYMQLSKELLRGNPWRTIKTALKEMRPEAFEPYTKFLYNRIERTKFQEYIEIEGVKYYSPDMRLRNSTIAEFSFADSAYYNWRQTNNKIWLAVLCASLFREANPTPSDLDARKPFIKQAVDKRADLFLPLPYKKLVTIAYAYEGCRNHIQDTYPAIFPKAPEDQQQQPKIKKKYISFGEIILDKIQGDPSKLQATNNTFLYDFLSIYNHDLLNLPKS